MGYDYQLLGGTLILIFSLVAVANAFVEKRSPRVGLAGCALALLLFGWAWYISGGQVRPNDVAGAVYRLIATFR